MEEEEALPLFKTSKTLTLCKAFSYFVVMLARCAADPSLLKGIGQDPQTSEYAAGKTSTRRRTKWWRTVCVPSGSRCWGLWRGRLTGCTTCCRYPTTVPSAFPATTAPALVMCATAVTTPLPVLPSHCALGHLLPGARPVNGSTLGPLPALRHQEAWREEVKRSRTTKASCGKLRASTTVCSTTRSSCCAASRGPQEA